MKTLALCAALLLAACVTPSGGDWCDLADPISLSDEAIAAMSDAEVNTALAHNEKGAELCGWKPRG